jgi:hypothetical protein
MTSDQEIDEREDENKTKLDNGSQTRENKQNNVLIIVKLNSEDLQFLVESDSNPFRLSS